MATKIKGELKYHTLHADVWTKLLGNSSEEAKARLQNSLNKLFPYALGIFEPTEHEQTLIEQGVFVGEDAIKQQWLQDISAIIAQTSLQMPTNIQPIYGGRKGYHTEYLQPMLNETYRRSLSRQVSTPNRGYTREITLPRFRPWE